MGVVRTGPPCELIDKLRARFEIPVFVETGTYKGDTAAWAASRFERVLTVERSEELHREATRRLTTFPNVKALLGDSRVALQKIIAEADQPAVFWLDAHWCGGQASAGANDQCPLLDEISIIRESREPKYILIDDARLFLSPPSPPHRVADWPSLSEVLGALQYDEAARTVVLEDVIVSVPAAAWDIVADYSHAVNLRQWIEHTTAAAPGVRAGAQMIARDTRLTLAAVRRRLRKLI